jgi:hypothetical protein
VRDTLWQEAGLFGCSIADNIRYGKPLASDAEVFFFSEQSCEGLFFYCSRLMFEYGDAYVEIFFSVYFFCEILWV